MLFSWLKTKDAVAAGAALADSFPTQAAASAIGEFMRTATQNLRAQNLNFYQRARFANAFRWRLLEKGVAADTAQNVTQTLLISSSGGKAAPASAPAKAPAQGPSSADAQPKGGPVDGHALESLFRQAEEALGRGQLDDAATHYQAYLVARPRDTAAINNLAVTYFKQGRYSDAVEQLRKAVARNPKNVDAYTNLGNALLQLHHYSDAEEAFRRVVSQKSSDLSARANLGLTLVLTGRLDSARTEFETVFKTSPEHAGALYGMALLERANDRSADAEALLWRAVQADPHLIRAWAAIPSLRRMTQADSKWLQNAQKLAASTQSAAEEAALRYALGKYFDDVGEYSQALASIKRANTLLKPLAPPFDAQAHAAQVAELASTYCAQALAEARISDSSPLRHVFVIGAPRSGVSLVGRVLGAHPEVTCVGQLDFWQTHARSDARRRILSENARKKLASEYVAAIRRVSPTASAVVDAIPANAEYIGLIHSVLPDARFIFMRRDPMATRLSCYFQPFTGTQNYAFELGDLTSFHNQHARLMSHWHSVLPAGSSLDLSYEELVANREAVTRQMLEFLGLGLDERCLQLPLNRESVERLQKYARLLES